MERGEGLGNPLQCSCLENPVDRGAWWAAVHRVAQSWTWLNRLSVHACIGEGLGNPLQYSCLENPRNRGAWWAAIYGVVQGWTWLKWLSSSRSRWECSLRENGYTYICGWVPSLFIWNYHKIINQLYPKRKQKVQKEKKNKIFIYFVRHEKN